MFPRFLLNPWVLLGVMFMVLSSCSTGYVAGRKHEANKWKAEEAQYLKALFEKEQHRKAVEYRLSEEAARKDAEIDSLHRSLSNEIRKATTGATCLNPDAVSVWNRAFDSIRSVPEGTGRVSEADPVPDASRATDTEVLERANEVAEILNKCRQQIDSIRRWNDEVPGK